MEFQQRIQKRLEDSGRYEVVAGEEIVWHPEVAKREGRRLQLQSACAILGIETRLYPRFRLSTVE